MEIGGVAIVEAMMVLGEGHHVKCTSSEAIFRCSEMWIVFYVDRLIIFIPGDGGCWVSEEFARQTFCLGAICAELIQVLRAACAEGLLGN